jgi:hypothetical protein
MLTRCELSSRLVQLPAASCSRGTCSPLQASRRLPSCPTWSAAAYSKCNASQAVLQGTGVLAQPLPQAPMPMPSSLLCAPIVTPIVTNSMPRCLLVLIRCPAPAPLTTLHQHQLASLDVHCSARLSRISIDATTTRPTREPTGPGSNHTPRCLCGPTLPTNQCNSPVQQAYDLRSPNLCETWRTYKGGCNPAKEPLLRNNSSRAP